MWATMRLNPHNVGHDQLSRNGQNRWLDTSDTVATAKGQKRRGTMYKTQS